MNLENLCTGCMTEKKDEGICPVCGWDGRPYGVPHYLQQRTLLNSRYYIGKVIGHGGFGITYLAWDTVLNTKVAIKEYFPMGLVTRISKDPSVRLQTIEYKSKFDYGQEKFLEEARTLVQFENLPGIVSVKDFFKANSTAYMVMNYLEGVTLENYLKANGGKIHYQTAISIMIPVMEALSSVHKVGILHRDVSPDNIFMTKDGQVKIIDFGAARYAIGETNKSMSIILKRGYAPQEQYFSKGNQGAWTDVYSLAATLYKMITGEIPPEALERMGNDTLVKPSDLGIEMPADLEQALIKALAVRATDRFFSMDEFKQAIAVSNQFNVTTPTDLVNATVLLENDTGTVLLDNNETVLLEQGESIYKQDESIKKKKSKKTIVFTSIAAIFLLVIVITALSVIANFNDNDDKGDEGRDYTDVILSWGKSDKDTDDNDEETEDDKTEDDDNKESNNEVEIDFSSLNLGNTSGNIRYYGVATQYDDKIYYVGANEDEGIYRMDLDGSNKECIIDTIMGSQYINVVDGYIYVTAYYFVDIYYVSGILRIEQEGGSLDTIYDVLNMNVENIIVQDDWIYFSLWDEVKNKHYLYKMRTDGSERSKMMEEPVYEFLVLGEWIFYTSYDSDNIYRIKTDGTNQSLVCEAGAGKLIAAEDRLYFLEYDGYNECIARVNYDGSEKEIISGINVTEFNILDGWIYYAAYDDETDNIRTLYKMRLDGSDNTKILDGPVYFINLVGDWIFFENQDGHCRIKTDGTELTVLE